MIDPQKTIKNLAGAISHLPHDAGFARAHLVDALFLLCQKHDRPGAALVAALSCRDISLLKRVFSTWNSQDWGRLYYHEKGEKIGTLIHEKCFDILCMLDQNGINVQGSFNLAIDAAVGRDDPDYITFLRSRFNDHRQIWKPKDFSYAGEKCGPGLAPFYLDALDHHIKNRHGAAIASFTSFRLGYVSLKPFAILLSSGHDLTEIYRSQLDRAHPHLASLISQTASSHGRLALHALEPDRLDVIGRDPDAMFFGMNAQTFIEDFPERHDMDPDTE